MKLDSEKETRRKMQKELKKNLHESAEGKDLECVETDISSEKEAKNPNKNFEEKENLLSISPKQCINIIHNERNRGK